MHAEAASGCDRCSVSARCSAPSPNFLALTAGSRLQYSSTLSSMMSKASFTLATPCCTALFTASPALWKPSAAPDPVQVEQSLVRPVAHLKHLLHTCSTALAPSCLSLPSALLQLWCTSVVWQDLAGHACRAGSPGRAVPRGLPNSQV